ncbi:MAG: polymorphic toxin-type HINT domain-containing protein [Polyangiaceae bacterium]
MKRNRLTATRLAIALFAFLVLLTVGRESRASTPDIHVGTAPVVAQFGPGTHIKFVTYTLYDKMYAPGGDAKVVRVWHGWAPSNNLSAEGVPNPAYKNPTFRDGSPVPREVRGDAGHSTISSAPELRAAVLAGGADAGFGQIVERAGGITVDGDGRLKIHMEVQGGQRISVATTSANNASLNATFYGDAENQKKTYRLLHGPEPMIFAETVEHILNNAEKEELLRNAPCECFVAGTAIATAKGRKRIEDVEEGDDVWSMGDDGPELHRVVHTMADPPRPTRFVTLSRGGHDERLETTDEHPFFVVGLGWTHAEALAAGNEVVTLSGETATVKSTESTKRSRPTFNFEVQGAHNYFVGTNQTLVHNTCAVAKRQARASRMTRFARLGNVHVGSFGGGAGGLLAGFIASYAGQSVAGEAGALGAAFGAAAVMNGLNGSSMRFSLGSAGASVGAAFLTSYALKSAGVTNPFAHAGAGIAAGALVDGAIAYGTWTAAAGGTAGAAAGTAMLSSGLWGVLAFEVTYHASQWYEIYQLNVAAANGDPAAQDALNEITFGGWLSPYNPQTYLLYGAYSWITRPGDVLGVSWLWGYKG